MSVSDRIQKLTPEQRAVLRAKLQKKVEGAKATPAAPARSFDDGRSPSPRSGSGSSNGWSPGRSTTTTPPTGFPDRSTPASSNGAYGVVAERHEALRATFPAVEGQPVQMSCRSRARCRPRSIRSTRRIGTAEAQRSRLEEVQTVRPRGRPSVSRSRPAHRTGRALLVLNFHHIVCDGWSANLLFRESGSPMRPCPRRGSTAAGVAGAGDPVCRLRPLAAAVAARRRALSPTRAVEAAARRRRPHLGAAGGPDAIQGPGEPRGAPLLRSAAEPRRELLDARPAGGGVTPFMGQLAAFSPFSTARPARTTSRSALQLPEGIASRSSR